MVNTTDNRFEVPEYEDPEEALLKARAQAYHQGLRDGLTTALARIVRYAHRVSTNPNATDATKAIAAGCVERLQDIVETLGP